MIHFETDPKKINSLLELNPHDPIFNTTSRHRGRLDKDNEEIRKLLLKVVSWRERKRNQYIPLSPKFSDNLANLTKVLKNPPLIGKQLRGGLTKIWVVTTNNHYYFLYYSKEGLSIEGDISLSSSELISDLKTLVKHMRA